MAILLDIWITVNTDWGGATEFGIIRNSPGPDQVQEHLHLAFTKSIIQNKCAQKAGGYFSGLRRVTLVKTKNMTDPKNCFNTILSKIPTEQQYCIRMERKENLNKARKWP